MLLICYGTRPEIIKLFPLIQSFTNNNIKFKTLFTGQHNDLIQDFYSLIPKPDFILEDIMLKGQSINKLTSKIITRMEEILVKNNNISHIIVQGDTTSAFAISLCGFYNKKKIIHLEAGLRTYNNKSPFPEEANRCLISQIADIHLTPTINAQNNLLKENIVNNVYNVGNTIIDAYEYVIKNIPIPLNIKTIIDKNKDYIIITLHRRENKGENIIKMWNELNEVSLKYKSIKLFYIKHPSLEDVTSYLNKNIILLEPQDYISMVYLISNCKGIISDSGGLQEEATCAKKKILICRNTTERPETIENNYGKLINTDIINNINFLFENNNFTKNNPYGYNVCNKIINIIKNNI